MVLTNGQQPLYGTAGCGCHQQSLSGPVASGDFTNIATNNAADGVYTLNGVPCAITDIIDLANPNTAFDPELDVDAGGIKLRFSDPTYVQRSIEIKQPLLGTLLTDGFTLVIEGYFDSAAGIFCAPHDESFDINPFGEFRNIHCQLMALDFTFFEEAVEVPPLDAISKIAVTMTDGRMAYSLNGLAAHAIEAGALSGLVDQIQLGVLGAEDSRLRSFAFYEVVDDADLPTLSAL